MSIRIVASQEQNQGIFDNGRIKERKPIAFPNEKPVTPSFSTLFYWAHAWSHRGGLIGEHPHRGFEICTFIIEGSIEHHDTKTRKWTLLERGDAQVIRSGSGIQHSEKMNPGSRLFQIWFDPNLKQSLYYDSSYSDYSEATFPIAKRQGVTIQTLVGQGSQIRLQTSTRIRRLKFKCGSYKVPMTPGFRSGIFVLEGKLAINDHLSKKNDFAVVVDEARLSINSVTNSDIFIVEVPNPAPYETFASTQN